MTRDEECVTMNDDARSRCRSPGMKYPKTKKSQLLQQFFQRRFWNPAAQSVDAAAHSVDVTAHAPTPAARHKTSLNNTIGPTREYRSKSKLAMDVFLPKLCIGIPGEVFLSSMY